MINSLYGKAYSNYMGIAIAFPTKLFKLTKCEIFRIADKIYYRKKTPETSSFSKIYDLFSFFKFNKRDENESQSLEDPWKLAKNRFNTCILCQFECLESGKKFFVGTYHMPCAYWCMPVMTIHAAELFIQCQLIAENYPLIIAGDFNFKPDS